MIRFHLSSAIRTRTSSLAIGQQSLWDCCLGDVRLRIRSSSSESGAHVDESTSAVQYGAPPRQCSSLLTTPRGETRLLSVCGRLSVHMEGHGTSCKLRRQHGWLAVAVRRGLGGKREGASKPAPSPRRSPAAVLVSPCELTPSSLWARCRPGSAQGQEAAGGAARMCG